MTSVEAADSVGERPPRQAGAAGRPAREADDGIRRPPAANAPRRSRSAVPPDDRLTAVLPTVRDDIDPHLRDPIDVVKAALDGTPPPKPPPPRQPPGGGRPPARAAADHPAGRPDPGRGSATQINWMWVRRSLYAMAVVFLVLPMVTFAMAYLIVDVPKPGDIRTNQVSTILASDGSELAKIVPPEGNRVDVNIDQIPVHVRDAVMAAEDRDFYSNPGFSFTGFARAAKNNIFGGDTQGGSTITQQYVKNALVGSERAGVGGLVRKAKELVISTKMSGEWSKDASAAVVSEHHLLRPRRLRHLGGVEGLLRQARRAAHRRRGCAAGRADPAAVDAGPRGRSRGCGRPVELGARRHGRHRRALAGRPCGAGVPADGAARSGPLAEPDHRAERADRAAGHQGAPRAVQHQRADAEHRGPAGHHHDRPQGAGRRRGSGVGVPRRPGPRHAHGDRVDRPAHRRGQGVLRRDGRQRFRLRAGRAADRLVVQGVRSGRRPAAGHGPGLPGGQLAGDGRRHQRSPTSRATAAVPATSPRRSSGR